MNYQDFYKKEEEAKDKFLKMSAEEFDKYMCEKYPNQFKERGLPMNQTCMCWGFCIGKGWYSILDKLCREYELIYKLTGIKVYFQQIKEKFGGARYYHSYDTSENKLSEEDAYLTGKFIDDLSSKAELDSDYTCAACGERRDKMVVIGSWVYDCCPECFKKLYPERTDGLEIWKKKDSLEDDMKDIIYYANLDEIARLERIAAEFKKAKEEEREQRRKEWEAKYPPKKAE